tara:strand:+ start:490 stop:687 length:198 start_codon:yes stop_codon:yes gene_type:complete
MKNAIVMLIKKAYKYNLGNMLRMNFLALFWSSDMKTLGATTKEKNIRLPIRNGMRKLIISKLMFW